MNYHVFGESTPGRKHSSTNSACLRLSGARFLTFLVTFSFLRLFTRSMLCFRFDQIFGFVRFDVIFCCLISYRILPLLKSQKSSKLLYVKVENRVTKVCPNPKSFNT